MIGDSLSDLGPYLEAFERARRETNGQSDGPRIDLEAYLPPADHPRRLAVLAELARIDLEVGWREGRPTPLEDYRRRFPALFDHRPVEVTVSSDSYYYGLYASFLLLTDPSSDPWWK